MKFTQLAALAALAASATAKWEIFAPASDVWWVAQSINSLSWSCKDPEALAHPTFSVLLTNSDSEVLTVPVAIISTLNNFDCSKTIQADQISFAAPGTGYTVQFVNPLNSTDVFVTSEPFEIRPAGSLFPTTTAGLDPASPSATAGTAQ